MQTDNNQRGYNWVSSELFAKIVKCLPICTVDVLFFDKEKDKILLFKRKNRPLRDEYFSSGGRLLKNEDFRDGALRKIREELGVELNSERLVFGGVINEIYKDSEFGEGVGYHAVNIFLGYTLIGTEEFVFDDQHSEGKWFDVNDSDLHRYIRERIKALREKL